jgi:hypothetical protein
MAKADSVHSTQPKNTTANRTRRPANSREKPKVGRPLSSDIREIAALDFEPIFQPSAGFLRPYGDDTFAELGSTTRTAILLLSTNKSQMVKAAADRGEDAWCRMLDDIHGASEILSEFGSLLKIAYARGIVVTGVMAVKEQQPTPRSPGATELLAAAKAVKARRVAKRRKGA